MFACAESCTGGLLCREMTRAAGASEVFWGGVVTYANQAKSALLGVPSDVIDACGAVSAEVAQTMVLGLMRVSGADLGVSVTGIAGPGGGSEDKPVGTVWLGLAARKPGGSVGVAVRVNFDGSRSAIQQQASRFARLFARTWWESDMDLDSLLSLTDNVSKPLVAAFHTPFSLSPHSP